MYHLRTWLQSLQSLARRIANGFRFLARRQLSPAPDPFAHAPCAHFTLDAAGCFVQLNAKALEWFDCEAEQVVGLCGPAQFFSSESREQFPGCLAVLQLHGQIDGLEFEMVTRRGATRRVWLYATAVYDLGRLVRRAGRRGTRRDRVDVSRRDTAAQAPGRNTGTNGSALVAIR